jgi:large subunit ribosomal protein L10
MKQGKPKAQVSEAKKKIVKDLTELMQKKTVMIVSIKNLPSSQLQDIRKKLREKALIKITKKSLIDFALEHSKNEKLADLVKYIKEDCAILFSEEDAFELSGFLSENKIPARAKPGQKAPEDIKIEAGPTDLLPGPDISALSSVGLQPKVEKGKINIMKEKILVKKGEIIDEGKASVLTKLDISPFKIGLEPIAAFSMGKIYIDIKIDKEKTLEDLQEDFSKALAFAVSINYPAKQALVYILSKANAHEKALNNLIKQDISEEGKKEKTQEPPSAHELAKKSEEKSGEIQK